MKRKIKEAKEKERQEELRLHKLANPEPENVEEPKEGEEAKKVEEPKEVDEEAELARKKKEAEEVETESDADYQEISIKRKMIDFRATHGPKVRFPEEMINEAVRWRLN